MRPIGCTTHVTESRLASHSPSRCLCKLPHMLGSYFALMVRLDLSQLQGNLGILAACGGEGRRPGECQAIGGCPGQELCDGTCGRWHSSSGHDTVFRAGII